MNTPQAVAFLDVLKYWLKLGFISFGGPAGQISMMHQELVERRRWISEHRFLHALNYCMVLPGPEAQQLATYIGWLMHGVKGGIIAGSLFVLPSLLLLILLTWIYLSFGQVPAVAGILYGIKPAVTAIVLFAAWRIGSRALNNRYLWGMATLAFIAIFFFNLPFPAIVIGAALLGALGGKLAPEKFKTGGGHGASSKNFGPALIDDDTPPPPHARFSWGKFSLNLGAGLIIWLLSMAVLLAWRGEHNVLAQMGWFFTKAALLTFGGAYAVLPYVYQGGVNDFHWLTATQMMDGLALGETTPGPLIMVVAFVGYVGGWNAALFGAEGLFGSGAAAASVATFFTFLPSFIFILAGGPLVEATRNDLKFTAPLTGITAAVVGVVLNLALFFAWHVLWPTGLAQPISFMGIFSGLDWFSLLLGLAAFVALFRFKISIMHVIGACALTGLLFGLLK